MSTFVCTWCASLFGTRMELEAHRTDSPQCRANARVSSPLQSRYGDAEMVGIQPGEDVLRKVRARSCAHRVERQRLVNAAMETIGYECGYCYTLLPESGP